MLQIVCINPAYIALLFTFWPSKSATLLILTDGIDFTFFPVVEEFCSTQILIGSVSFTNGGVFFHCIVKRNERKNSSTRFTSV
jgi:hypothetical protein